MTEKQTKAAPCRLKQIVKFCPCVDKYSIEKHGKGYALYYGRCQHRHGFNLCLLSEFDSEGQQTRALIERALNVYFGT